MTYGEITSRMREDMMWLLERRRIQQRIGGAGNASIAVTTTEAQRAELGVVIQRYRDAVIVYCREAINTAAPVPKPGRDTRYTDPVEALRYRLDHTLTTPESTPLSDVMAHHPEFELVAKWQDLARSAVEGERELAMLRRTPLTPEQSRTILKDSADLVRGLVILDIRHEKIPGWEPLQQPKKLSDWASAVAGQAVSQAVDHSVDALGWRPTPGLIQGPALPGVAGALQAQNNVVVDLATFPSAVNLRHILLAQAQLAGRTVPIAESVDPSVAAQFSERAQLYRKLAAASRTVGGELGAGRIAALESANAAQRINAGPGDWKNAKESLGRLARLNDRVDARISVAIEHGFREKLYFTAITLPCLGAPGRDGIQRPAQKWIPVDSPRQSELLELVHRRLRPAPAMPLQPKGAGSTSRAVLHKALTVEKAPRYTMRR